MSQNFLFPKIGTCALIRPFRFGKRGVRPIVTERETECDGRVGSQDVRHVADGQAVWSCPPDAGVKLIEMRCRPCGRNAEIDRRRRLTSPELRGEHGAADKPLRRECRVFSALPDYLVCTSTLSAHKAAGAASARYSLPLCFREGHRQRITRARIVSRECFLLSSPSPGGGGSARMSEAKCVTGWGDPSIRTLSERRDCHPTPPLISFAIADAKHRRS
jgi:hypothetical protein